MNLNQCRWLNDVFDSINFENLPHGIIINGSTGIGKNILAKEIANNILLNFEKDNNFKHQVLFDKNTHPDFYLLDKDKIGVNDISRRDKWDEEKGFRDVVTFLTMTPSISKNKVVLIMNADLMNNAAQNALLKSLEEPAPYSYIIMTTNRPKALNQTIYSRCRQININNLSVIETNHWLEKVGVTDYNAIDFPSFANVTNTSLNTTISNDFGVRVSTIEHLMGALFGLGIDNALIEIDNEEVPILDGSAKEFIEKLIISGLKQSEVPIKIIKIKKKISFNEGERSISIEPSKLSLDINFQLKYDNAVIGNQKNKVNVYEDDLNDIFNSRTFCLYEDIEKIKKNGLAKGGSLDNAVVVKCSEILNKEILRNF